MGWKPVVNQSFGYSSGSAALWCGPGFCAAACSLCYSGKSSLLLVTFVSLKEVLPNEHISHYTKSILLWNCWAQHNKKRGRPSLLWGTWQKWQRTVAHKWTQELGGTSPNDCTWIYRCGFLLSVLSLYSVHFFSLYDLLTIVTNMRRLTGPTCYTHPPRCSASFVIQTQLQQFAKDSKTRSFLPLFIFQHLSSNELMLCWNTCLQLQQDVHSAQFYAVSQPSLRWTGSKRLIMGATSDRKALYVYFKQIINSYSSVLTTWSSFFSILKFTSTICLKNCRLELQNFLKLHRF